MSGLGSREDRWQNVTTSALYLEERLARAPTGLTPEERAREIRALLDSLLEVFPSSLDPVEDFEGFAVRKLAQALRRGLEGLGCASSEIKLPMDRRAPNQGP